jgi:hypothetical protein
LECERALPSDFTSWAAREQHSIDDTLAKIRAKSAKSKLGQAMKKHEFSNFTTSDGLDRIGRAELESRGKVPIVDRDRVIKPGMDCDEPHTIKDRDEMLPSAEPDSLDAFKIYDKSKPGNSNTL